MSKLTKLCGKLKETVELGEGEDKIVLELKAPKIEDLSEIASLFSNKDDEKLSDEEYEQIEQAQLKGMAFEHGVQLGQQSKEKMKELSEQGGSWNDMEDYYSTRQIPESGTDMSDIHPESYVEGYEEGLGDKEKQEKLYKKLHGE